MLLKTAFLTRSDIYRKWAKKGFPVSLCNSNDFALKKSDDEFDCAIIELQYFMIDLEKIMKRFEKCRKIIVISSVPFHQLPNCYKNILCRSKSKFRLMPITLREILNEIEVESDLKMDNLFILSKKVFLCYYYYLLC